MNNAQKGSVHRQFYQSPHRQRIIQMVIPSGILVERIHEFYFPPFPTDFTGLPDYSIFTYADGKNEACRPFSPSPYNPIYSKFTINLPNTTWTKETSGIPHQVSCWPSGGGAGGDFKFSGIGVGCSKGIAGWLSKMRIHFPAVGVVGYYYGYALSGYSTMTLQSSQIINHTAGTTEIFPPYPTIGPALEPADSLAMFFFGLEDASTIPLSLSSEILENGGSQGFQFP